MSVIGFNINSINAKLGENADRKGDISVNSAPAIIDIEKRDMGLPWIGEVLAIGFRFETKYDPKIGEIAMEGEVLYHSTDQKDILARWKKEKKLDDKMAVEVLNAIFRHCLIRALDVSNELRLPPPISFPVVKPKDK